MKKIIAVTITSACLLFSLSALAQASTNEQVQPAQVDRRELIAVAASATQDKKYFLTLRVANNVVELFPDYGTGYLYRAIAQYRLGKREVAKVEFARAKKLDLMRLKSAKISTPEANEARSGLEVAELHLQLLSSPQ